MLPSYKLKAGPSTSGWVRMTHFIAVACGNSSEAGVELKWPLVTRALATGRGRDGRRGSQGRCAGLTGGREALGVLRAYTWELGLFCSSQSVASASSLQGLRAQFSHRWAERYKLELAALPFGC